MGQNLQGAWGHCETSTGRKSSPPPPPPWLPSSTAVWDGVGVEPCSPSPGGLELRRMGPRRSLGCRGTQGERHAGPSLVQPPSLDGASHWLIHQPQENMDDESSRSSLEAQCRQRRAEKGREHPAAYTRWPGGQIECHQRGMFFAEMYGSHKSVCRASLDC